jgi:hypothetical protein
MVRAIVTAPPPTAAPHPNEISLGTRLWYAWVCFFRVLFDANFANRTWQANHGLLLPAPAEPAAAREKPPVVVVPAPSVEPALQLLALFQREGRFVDFLEEDVVSFSDADVGAAARVVHQGCRKALHDHAKIAPVRTEEEGSKVTVPKGAPPSEVKLIGNVVGEPPFTGTLRHRGWRVSDLHLPTAIDGHDLTVVAPAEVEL